MSSVRSSGVMHLRASIGASFWDMGWQIAWPKEHSTVAAAMGEARAGGDVPLPAPQMPGNALGDPGHLGPACFCDVPSPCAALYSMMVTIFIAAKVRSAHVAGFR